MMASYGVNTQSVVIRIWPMWFQLRNGPPYPLQKIGHVREILLSLHTI